MSHFYGSIEGDRSEATRQGSKKNGISGHVRGWDFGVRVLMRDEDGVDTAGIYLTSGSNGHASEKAVGTFTAADLTTREEPVNGLLALAMFDLGKITGELSGKAGVAMQDGDEDRERGFCAAIAGLNRTAAKLATVRSDGDEELALMELRDLADGLTALYGYTKVREVYDRLAMVPAAR